MITLKTIAKSIEPNWKLEDWFNWPPNIFALISIVLQRTGAYKISLVEDAYWQNGSYRSHVNHDARLWAAATSKSVIDKKAFSISTQGFETLHKQFEILNADWNQEAEMRTIDLNKLRSFDLYNPKNADKSLVRYATALAHVLAIADAACAGLGVISDCLPSTSDNNLGFKVYANVLLNATGSLATIYKFHGAVLPKMRTPQSGIVLRSMTHHLTFHQTEVEVVWRTFPWVENRRQSLNVMVVPVPYKIYKTDFEIVEKHHPHTKYFKVKPKQELDKKMLDAIADEVCRKATTNNDVDLLVFPEMSLSKMQYKYLLGELARKRHQLEKFRPKEHNGLESCRRMPVVIAGVLSDDSKAADPEILTMDNQVRLAVFFHGNWYDISQLKHHRWQLDRSQIVQYGLEGQFSTEFKWTEYCSIMQRRLTVLCPNDWLSITALICEDLARQEPVGEVIRGIGPTILTALLSDGPQIKERWSARYASVLADDPGTSVLSITSKGMAERSRRNDGTTDKDKDLTIGLWKDMIKNWDLLKLEKDHDAIMFTISSKFAEEHTLDGRPDHGATSVFKLDSIAPKQIKFDKLATNKPDSDSEPDSEPDPIPEDVKAVSAKTIKSWLDLRTLSTWTFIVDSLVDLFCTAGISEDYKKWIDRLFHETEPKRTDRMHQEVRRQIITAWNKPSKTGTSIGEGNEASAGENENEDARNREILKALNELTKLAIRQQSKFPAKMFVENFIAVAKKLAQDKTKSTELKELAVIFLHNIGSKLADIIKQTPVAVNATEHFNPSKMTSELSSQIRETLDLFDRPA